MGGLNIYIKKFVGYASKIERGSSKIIGFLGLFKEMYYFIKLDYK